MAVSRTDAEGYVLTTLRMKGVMPADSLMGLLRKTFPAIDEEAAGEILWGLIDAHIVQVTDEAELEARPSSD